MNEVRRLGIALIGCATLLAASAAAQRQPERLRVNADNVNLRIAPSIDSAIVRGLARGTTVTVLAREGAWVKVQALVATGWARSSQFAVVPTSDTIPLAAAETVTVVAPPTKVIAAHPRTATRGAPRGGLGVLAGISSATVVFNAATTGVTFAPRTGIAAGLAIASGGTLGWELDAMFVQQGFELHAPSFVQSIQTSVGRGSLLFRLAIGNRAASVALFGGPAIGYELNCSETVVASSSACQDDPGFDAHRKLDYGAVGGIGLQVGAIGVQARYQIGLRNMYTDGAGGHGTTRALLVLAGFTF